MSGARISCSVDSQSYSSASFWGSDGALNSSSSSSSTENGTVGASKYCYAKIFQQRIFPVFLIFRALTLIHCIQSVSHCLNTLIFEQLLSWRIFKSSIFNDIYWNLDQKLGIKNIRYLSNVALLFRFASNLVENVAIHIYLSLLIFCSSI